MPAVAVDAAATVGECRCKLLDTVKLRSPPLRSPDVWFGMADSVMNCEGESTRLAEGGMESKLREAAVGLYNWG